MDTNTALQRLSDRAELVKFMSDPRGWVVSLGFDPEDEQVARTFEKVANSNFSAMEKNMMDFDVKAALPSLQGIGFGCCNSL